MRIVPVEIFPLFRQYSRLLFMGLYVDTPWAESLGTIPV
jgi:hypothetical protein